MLGTVWQAIKQKRSPGDRVDRDEPIALMMTDEMEYEIAVAEAQRAATLTQIQEARRTRKPGEVARLTETLNETEARLELLQYR